MWAPMLSCHMPVQGAEGMAVALAQGAPTELSLSGSASRHSGPGCAYTVLGVGTLALPRLDHSPVHQATLQASPLRDHQLSLTLGESLGIITHHPLPWKITFG